MVVVASELAGRKMGGQAYSSSWFNSCGSAVSSYTIFLYVMAHGRENTSKYLGAKRGRGDRAVAQT
jgi:hypothetical protein